MPAACYSRATVRPARRRSTAIFVRSTLLATAALATLFAAGFLAGCGDRRPVRLVVITLDTMRYDGLVPAEGEESPMPNLMQRVREGGLVFERFYAATSVTQPSHASMFTALHPWEHGVVSNGQILLAEHTTVAERLQEAGFATGGVIASFPVAGRFGFAQGFDEFSEDFVEQPVAWRQWEGHEVPEETFYSLGETITDRGLEMLDRLGGGDAGKSQFLWLHYFDPHDPYGDSAGVETMTPFRAFRAIDEGRDPSPLFPQFRTKYDQDLAFLDDQLERIFDRLEVDAERYRTHVVIASDHGESFGEEGAIAHGKRITEEQIRVPLVILSPEVEPGVRGDVAGSIDVATTLLSLAGLPFDEAPWSAGRDLTEPAPSAAEVEPSSADLRGGAFGMRRTFRNRDTTERRADGTTVPIPRYLFYAVDRAGRVYRGNTEGFLEGSAPDSEHLRRQVLSAFASFQRQAEEGAAPDAKDPETQDALRALGYLD